MDSKQDFKIREFDWFSVETKVRKLVADLVSPYLKMMKDDKKLVEGLELQMLQNG